MKSRTSISIEYTPCGLTAQGAWRPITPAKFATEAAAEKYLQKHKEDCAACPGLIKRCEAYKVMKRTVVLTIGEWEDV